jgi:hypothetical protein
MAPVATQAEQMLAALPAFPQAHPPMTFQIL